MVSIGNGLNNPYLQQKSLKQPKTNGAQENKGASGSTGVNRAPSVPNFPEQYSSHTEGNTRSGSVVKDYFGHFKTKEEASNYVNRQLREFAKNDISSASFNEHFPNCDSVTFGPVTQNPETGDYVMVGDPEFDKLDIKSISFKQNSDGTFAVSFTFEYSATYSETVKRDWKAGDTYKDENGYTWEYQSNGSWKDITDSVNNNNHIVGGKPNSDVSRGGTTKNDKNLSTAEFLQMRDVKINLDTINNNLKKPVK